MVTSHHEAAHRIFQERPQLLVSTLRILDVPLPDGASFEVLPTDTTEIEPLERRVDSVLRVTPPSGRSFVVAIESQRRPDPDKGFSWAYYLGYLKSRYKCQALLLAVCPDKATATWAAGPFDLGPDGWVSLSVRPLALGPDNVPVIADPAEAARNMPMATLSAMMHGRNPGSEAILEALARALGAVGDEDAKYYAHTIEAGLGTAQAREIWRNLVDTYIPPVGSLVEERFKEIAAEGEAKGEAKALLRVLERRGVTVPAAVRERVTNCTDLDTLNRWLDRALEVAEAEDLFAEDEA
jgi:hypothetical protein